MILVAPSDCTGCGFYRLMVPFLALRDRGYDVAFIDSQKDPRLKTCDVLVLNRQTKPEVLEMTRAIQARGGKIVYEFDDNVHAIPHDNPASRTYGTGKPATVAAEGFIREADLVIVSTPDLAGEYRRFREGRPTSVCYNVMRDSDIARLRPPSVTGEPKRPGELRIGWAGSGTHFGDLRLVRKPLLWALDTFPEARIALAGLGKPSFLGKEHNEADAFSTLFPEKYRSRIDWIGRTFRATDRFRVADVDGIDDLPTVRYYEMIAAADYDLAIAPIVSSTFNRSKSYLKLIEYGALGIPSVASNFGPYREYVYGSPRAATHDPPALLAHDDRGWKNHLGALLESSRRRAALAERGLVEVATRHAISVGVTDWELALARIGVRATVAA